tara:strand:- start:8847 stop:9554 length:708 start_codon:yes stop_codon:yes gene_type:complete
LTSACCTTTLGEGNATSDKSLPTGDKSETANPRLDNATGEKTLPSDFSPDKPGTIISFVEQAHVTPTILINNVALNLDPYLPPNDPAKPVEPQWLRRGWNTVLLGVFSFFCVLSYPALRLYVGELSPQSTQSDWMIACSDVTYIGHGVISVGMFLLTLGTYFSCDRGYAWRIAYVCVSLLFVCDPYLLRPTQEGVISATIYALMVLPVPVFGLGWLAMVRVGYIRIRSGRNAGAA